MERRPIRRPVEEGALPEIPPTEAVPLKKEEQVAPAPELPDDDAAWAAEIEKEKAALNQVIETQEQIKQETQKQEESIEEEDREIAELERQLAAKRAAKQQKQVQATTAPKQPEPKLQQEPVAEQPTPSPFEKLQKDEVGGTVPEVEEQVGPDKEESVDPVAEQHQKIAARNNCSTRVFTDNGTDDDLDNALITYDKEDTRDEDAKEDAPSEEVIKMSLCAQIGQKTKQARMMNRYILELEKLNQRYQELKENVLRLSKITPRLPKNDKTTPIHLTGDAAKIAVLSRTQGLYRIMLYNSGFWITIRPMQVVDASAFVHEVDADFKELGRILGGQFHLVLGAYLKQKVLEILPNIIVSSNLEDWDQPDILGEAIAMHDYDTILWGICCSMYRDGIGIGVYCTNMECRYQDLSQYVDLTKACFINPDVFNEEAMIWMRDTRTTRTLNDCITYRNRVLKGEQSFTLEDGTIFRMKVPSLQTYAKRSIELIGKMQASIYRAKTQKNKELQNQVIFHIYKMLAPWISAIIYKNPNDADTVIEGYDAICTAVESQAESNHTLYEKLEEYIRNTKCSMYCLTSIECPKCHKKPDLNSEGLFPLDVEYLFFGLSCLKLEQTGAQL